MKLSKMALYIVIILLSLAIMGYAQNENETCTTCHDDEELTGLNLLDQEVSMFANDDMINSSIHSGFACVDCHSDLDGFEDFPHDEELVKVDCSTCHDEISEIFLNSSHGMTSNPKTPDCASCHGKHDILSHRNPESPTSPKKLPYTCSNCHLEQILTDDPDIKFSYTFDRYMRGIHAQGIAKGIGSAASCDDCHGVHDLKPASDINSKVNKMNIPKTCAKCHNDIYIQYSRGIHGKALSVGILDSPNCSDCHGEHEILEIDNPDSPVNHANLSDYVCGKCHNDPVLVEKFSLGDDRFTSYQDTYHGLAIAGGSVKASTCASCHKAHDILPAANPASSIHPDNLTKTCQKCHIDANYAFASSYTHKTAYEEYNVIDDIVKDIYIIAIVLIIGAMVIHNLIILGRYLSDKNRENKNVPSVKRFSGHMIYQHMLVTIAFIMLALTGFALRYPNEWWVGILNFFGIFESARGVIHRISAVILIYVSVHHTLYLFLIKRGRYHFKQLLPTKDDFIQPFQNIRYHLRMTDVKPKFGFYDYTMKAEYWALVWGTIVMAGTGFVLWYPTFFTSFLPPWIVKISETIHFYEAWLATLAIAVFHFFFVIFHPTQYPMSFTWLTGKMAIDEVKHHHERWYEEMQKEEKESADKDDIETDKMKTV